VAATTAQEPAEYSLFAPVTARQLPLTAEPPLAGYLAVLTARSFAPATDSEIYTVRADGSQVRQLTDNSVSDIFPVFSPDGTKIAFWRETEADLWQVRVMNRDGSGERIVSKTDSYGAYPIQWSPDGSHLLTTSEDQYTLRYAMLLGVEEGTIVELGGHIQYRVLAWSPDGRYFHYADSADRLWAYSMENGSATQVGTVLIPPPATIEHPVVLWHPDSEALVFHNNNGVFAVRPDGTGLRELAPHAYRAHGWWNNTMELLLSNEFDLFTVPFTGGDITFFANGGSNVEVGGISPAGDAVIYQVDFPTGPIRYKDSVSASVALNTCDQPPNEGCWLHGVSLAGDDGALAFGITSNSGPPPPDQVVYVPLGAGAPQPVRVEGAARPRFLPGSARHGWGEIISGSGATYVILDLPAGTMTELAPGLGGHYELGGWQYVGTD
jgi:hypothetical protein